MDTKVKWEKTGTGSWKAAVNGKTCFVSRVIRVRSWAYEPKFGHIPGVRKPRHCLRTALVSATVKIGDEWHRLARPDGIYSVRDAQAAAIRYAMTGEGQATITRLDD